MRHDLARPGQLAHEGRPGGVQRTTPPSCRSPRSPPGSGGAGAGEAGREAERAERVVRPGSVGGGFPRSCDHHIIKLLIRYFDQLGRYALGELGARVADRTIRVPDVAVLTSGDQLGWDQMTLPASAYHTIVEVVSDDSETRDKVTRAEEYAQAGLANYGIVWEPSFRPDDAIVARYTNDGGRFRLQDTVLLSELLAAPSR